MPFGTIDGKMLEVVPGTSSVSDQDDLPPEYADLPRDQLKHGKGRVAHIILIPQPSDSPNDPLHWPQWKKELILLSVSLAAAVVGAFGPMYIRLPLIHYLSLSLSNISQVGSGFVEISAQLNITVEILSQSIVWLILTIGLGLFIANPLASLFGRRPI
jgi:hypothetical protein